MTEEWGNGREGQAGGTPELFGESGPAKQKDIFEKSLEDYEDVFRDIVNVLLFRGEEIVQEGTLNEGGIRSVYGAMGKGREQERDCGKIWKGVELRLSYFGLENMTDIDPDMPIRVIGYDGAEYRNQLKHVKGKDGKVKRNCNPRYPVVTVVLYFGCKRRWKKPRSLRESLGDIPECLQPYVNDYKLHIFEIAWLTEEQIAMFQSDFRIVADFLAQQRKGVDYVPVDQPIVHGWELMHLLGELAPDGRFDEMGELYKNGEEGPKKMCEMLDRIENRGIEKGKQIGREEERVHTLQEAKMADREKKRANREKERANREKGRADIYESKWRAAQEALLRNGIVLE